MHGEEEIGGLVGWNDGEIKNCYASGDVTSEYDADRLGGLVGRNCGPIESCYASGSIVGGCAVRRARLRAASGQLSESNAQRGPGECAQAQG